MTAIGIPNNAKQLAALVKQGEGPALEFKRSTGELKEGMQTFCAFLNGTGGTVLFGVRSDGTVEGQAELFCQRHFPMPAKIVPGQLRRVEAPLIPVDAMREILVNAIIHRDYSIAGGSISLAIFDERVEVWSAGTFPTGITPEQLSKSHLSVQRNPIIADVFNRAGLIEKWGRGTNRVIAMCREAGVAPPTFEEITGAAVVTFKVNVMGRTVGSESGQSQVRVRPESATQSATQSTDPVERLLICLAQGEMSAGELRSALGIKHRPTFRANYLHPALAAGWIEYTLPDKPNSRLQKYRLTPEGERAFKNRGGENQGLM